MGNSSTKDSSSDYNRHIKLHQSHSSYTLNSFSSSNESSSIHLAPAQPTQAVKLPMTEPAPVTEVWVGGRRLITSSSYTFPVDPDLMNMNDLNHYTFRKWLHGKNYCVYMTDPKTFLDIGAGNGIWAKEIAIEFPKARVYALELVDDIFNKVSAPNNVQWEVGNILAGTNHEDNYFDYVQMRCLLGAIPTENAQAVVNEMFRVTKPGGWACLQDTTNVLHNAGPKFKEWFRLMEALCARAGVHPQLALQYEAIMHNAGFVEVKVKKFKRRLGSWAGEMGSVSVDAMKQLCLIFPIMMPDLITEDQAIDYNATVFDDEVNTYHSALEWVYVMGKKP